MDWLMGAKGARFPFFREEEMPQIGMPVSKKDNFDYQKGFIDGLTRAMEIREQVIKEHAIKLKDKQNA